MALYVVLALSIQMVWKMLGTIQLLVHFPLCIVSIPANLVFALQMVADLANLKLIPMGKVNEFLFNLKASASKEKLGYSNNIIESIGLLLLIFVVAIVCMLLLMLLSRIAIVRKIVIKLKEKLLFNPFLRAMVSCYLVLLVSALFGL